jgi:hypothetical protein
LNIITGFLIRYLWPVILALVLAVIGAGYGWMTTERANGRLRADLAASKATTEKLVQARKDDAKVLARLRGRQAAERAKTARETTRLDDAVAVNRPWADVPLPKEVRDALAE